MEEVRHRLIWIWYGTSSIISPFWRHRVLSISTGLGQLSINGKEAACWRTLFLLTCRNLVIPSNPHTIAISCHLVPAIEMHDRSVLAEKLLNPCIHSRLTRTIIMGPLIKYVCPLRLLKEAFRRQNPISPYFTNCISPFDWSIAKCTSVPSLLHPHRWSPLILTDVEFLPRLPHVPQGECE